MKTSPGSELSALNVKTTRNVPGRPRAISLVGAYFGRDGARPHGPDRAVNHTVQSFTVSADEPAIRGYFMSPIVRAAVPRRFGIQTGCDVG